MVHAISFFSIIKALISWCLAYALHSSTNTKVGPSEGLDTLNFILWKDAHAYTAATSVLQIAVFKISASHCHLYLNGQHSPGRYHLTVPSIFQRVFL